MTRARFLAAWLLLSPGVGSSEIDDLPLLAENYDAYHVAAGIRFSQNTSWATLGLHEMPRSP